MIKKIDHIALAVKNLEAEIKKYREILGLHFLGIEEVEEQKVRVALFDVNGIRIELMEPLADDSPVSHFLEKRGGGIHHIALEVDGLAELIEIFGKYDIRMINPELVKGAFGSQIAFIHPQGFSGALIELVEKK